MPSATVDGSVAESYRYSAYGKARLFDNAGTEISASAAGNPYGYTGRRLDPESGLLYYRNRYYSPDLGRFLSRDPAGQVDGLNVYAYVRGNPLAHIDPWGLSARRPLPAPVLESATGAFWGELARAFIGRSDIEPADEASPWDQGSFVFGKTLIRNTPEAVGSVGQIAWGTTEAVLGSGYIAGSGGAGVTAGGWALAVDASSNVAGGGTRYWNLLTGDSRPDADLVGQGFRTAATKVGLPPVAGDMARAAASMATLSALQSVTYAQQQAAQQAALRASTTQSTTQGPGNTVFRSGTAGSAQPQISLADARAAAESAGIDMRMFDLAYEPGTDFAFISQTGSGALWRAPNGRIVLTMQDAGLGSAQAAVESIAHELNHVRGILNTGVPTTEAAAEAAARAAGAHLP